MSFPVIRWALQQRGIKSTARHVLIALADAHNGKTGRCDPSQERLAEVTGLGRSTVITALGELEDAGLLIRKRRRNARTRRQESTFYVLQIGGTESGSRSRAESKSETRAESGNVTDPSPDFGQSRVQQPDTNLEGEPGTEPGKRRTHARKVRVSRSWRPSEGVLDEIRTTPGLDEKLLEEELANFIDWCLETSAEFVDPDARFRRWMRQGAEYRERNERKRSGGERGRQSQREEGELSPERQRLRDIAEGRGIRKWDMGAE